MKSDKAKKVHVRLMWSLLNQGRSLKTELALPNGRAFFMCAEHFRQLGGVSPLHNLMEVKG